MCNDMILAENTYLEAGFKKNMNCLVLGVPGSGKTRGHILPNLCQMEDSSAVLLDPKGELYALFNGALECYVHAERFAELRLQGYFYDILYGIVKQVERRRLKQEEDVGQIYKALIHLNDHYMSEVTAEELAAMCGMSVATFRRLFKKYKQTSPLKYKNHLRMLHAREMLQSGLYTVSEICELVNCTDLSHFNKMYRAEFGINPSADMPD